MGGTRGDARAQRSDKRGEQCDWDAEESAEHRPDEVRHKPRGLRVNHLFGQLGVRANMDAAECVPTMISQGWYVARRCLGGSAPPRAARSESAHRHPATLATHTAV